MNDQPSDSLALDSQLCFKLYAASRAVIRGYKPMLDQLRLTYPQYLVMLVLWEQDGPTVSELGDRLSLDSGTLTPLLKRMEAAGWLTRERSAEDERRVLVWLTPAGQDLKQQARAIPQCVLQAADCKVHDIRTLTAQVRALTLAQALTQAMGLSPDRQLLLTQTVGYPPHDASF